MNKNEIILGDAYKLIKEVPDKSIDLIVTDPPYLIKGWHTGTGMLKDRNMGYTKELMEQEETLLKGIDNSILDEFVRVLKKINCYIWCNKEQIYDYLTYFVKERNCSFEIIIWAKSNPSPFLNGHYLKDKEYCLYFWEQEVKLKPEYDKGRTFYYTASNQEDKKNFGHPTIKPKEIIKNLILNSSGGGDMIFDPFAGSGTTCVAAKELGRGYLGFEISPKYHEIAVARVNGVKRIVKTESKTIEQLGLF